MIPGRGVLDLGTDHAQVPEALLLADIVPWVIAADRSTTVVAATSRRLAQSPIADRVSLRVGDGLDVIAGDDVATVVMAGFGGDAMVRVLARGPTDGIDRFVLQPQLDLALVRRHLVHRGLALVDEHLCEDRRRFYVVLVAEPVDRAPDGISSLDLADALYGPWLRRRGGSRFARYLQAERRRTKSAKAAALAADVDPSRLGDLDARLAVLARLLAECRPDHDGAR